MADSRRLLPELATLLSFPLALACSEYVPPSGTGGAPGGGGGPGTGGAVTGGTGAVATGGSGAVGTGGSGAVGATGGSGTGGGVQTCGTTAHATDAANLDFSSTIMLPTVEVAPRSLPTFDWSAVTKNFLGHPIQVGTPSEIKQMVLVVWSVSPEEIARMINEDDPNIEQYTDFSVQLDVAPTPERKSAPITEFLAPGGNPVTEAQIQEFLDPVYHPPASTTYTIIAQNEYTLGHGAQMIQAFVVNEASTNTMVALTDDSTELEYEAHLSGGTKVDGTSTEMVAATPGITMEWKDISATSFGPPDSFIINQVSEVLVGRYTESVTDIENDFLNLEFIAEDMWRGPVTVAGSIDLSTLTHTTMGTTFPGVTNDGSTWMIALLCDSCINPTPWYVSPIQTCQ